MPAFAFEAVNPQGKTKKGVLEGDNARQIRQQLREQGLIPVAVDQVKEQHNDKGNSLQLAFFKPRISAGELALLTRQLATLVEAALPIEEALLAVAEQSEKPRQKNMMMAVRSKVVEGFGLAESLSDFPSVFDTLFIAMVAAGEKSGHLDIVLNRLADYTENREKTRSQVIQAMIYPALMMFFAVAITVLLLTVVVPKIVTQFEHMGQGLPPITQMVMDISTFLQASWMWVIVAIILAIIVAQRTLRIPAMKLKFHRWILGVPLLGKVNRGLNTARFARTLSILTASAVPLLEAMKIASDVLLNQHIKAQVAESAIMVKEGASLRTALDKTNMFPPMMMNMIASGERSGELQGMLARAADNQDREFESMVNVSLKLLEPAMIASMAVIVLFIVMAILQPIMAMNKAVVL